MAKIDQKDRYRQRAALCYEIAATLLGDQATSMMRLGDTYAGLAEDSDKPRTDVFVTTEGNECPNCVKCGKEMRHTYSLPRTDTLRAMRAFRCDSCDKTMICKGSITELKSGEGPGGEQVAEIRRAVLDDLAQELGAIPEQAEVSPIQDTRRHSIKREVENKSRRVDIDTTHEPRKLDQLLREHERLLATREEMFGPDHPDTAASLDALANLLRSQADLAGAWPLYERALAIREKVLGSEHPNTASSLDALANLLHSQGDLAGAGPLYERALMIYEKVLGPQHPDTASSLDNLANLLHSQGDLAGARPLYERALAIRENALGPDHPDTASSLDNLANLLHTQGDFSRAGPLLERALVIREEMLGPKHPDTAASLNNLGDLLRSQGDLAGARPLAERAAAIYEEALGAEHPRTGVGIHNLARLLQDQGDLAGARSLYKRALAINEKALGQEHPDTAAGLNNLADVFRAQGDFTEARPLMERALTIYDKALGPEHPNTNRVRYNFARLLSAMGQTDEALAHSQAALASHKKILGQNHHWTKDSACLAARLLFRHALGSVSRPSDEILVGRIEKAAQVVEGTDGRPNSSPPPSSPATAKEVGNEAKRPRIIARSRTGKAQLKKQGAPANQQSPEPSEPPPIQLIAKAEAGRTVEGFDGRLNSSPRSSTTTAKEVGNEANRSRMIARSGKAQLKTQAAPAEQQSPELPPNQPIAEAETIYDEVAGPEHPDTAASLYNFANLLHSEGDLAGARPLYERALVIYDKVLGPEHPNMAAGLNNLADLLHTHGDLAGARPLIERALAIYDKVLGPEHPDTNRVRYNFARLLSDMGQTDEALVHSQAALASHKKILGRNHHWTTDSASLAARLLFRHALGSVSRPSDEIPVGRIGKAAQVVEGTDGRPNSLPLPSSPATAKEVGNEANRPRIIARSRTGKAQLKTHAAPAKQESPQLSPNQLIAKAEAPQMRLKFEEAWALHEKSRKKKT